MKYVLASALMGALFLFGLVSLTANLFKDITSQEVEHRVKVINDMLGIVLLPALIADNTDYLNQSVSAILSTNELAYLHIYDENEQQIIAEGIHTDSHSHKHVIFTDDFSGLLDQELFLTHKNSELFHVHYGVNAGDLISLVG